jgi:hypothetical protein
MNSTLSGNHKPPPGWKLGFTLDSDHVWNGFTILSLLEVKLRIFLHGSKSSLYLIAGLTRTDTKKPSGCETTACASIASLKYDTIVTNVHVLR